jgi:hypothetical protein
MRLGFLVALIFGVLAAPALADTEPLPAGTEVVPRDGQIWTASSWPNATPFEMRDFVVYASDYEELPDEYAFAVAADPATDAHGILTNPIDRYEAPAQPLHPGIYAAPTSLGARWLGTAGTYYWQASYVDDDDGDLYISPVRALTIVAQPPSDPPVAPTLPAPARLPAVLPVATPRPPSPGTVRIALRRAIAAATHRSPRGIVYRCTRAPAAATCRPSWRDVRFRYRGTLSLTFGTSAITATFRGTRVPRKPGKVRAVTWATSF